jgi:modulator of FtsH protease HflK
MLERIMAWNEPGKDKDPWGGRSGNTDGPPDLDEALKKFQKMLNGIFGGGSGGGKDSGSGAGILVGIIGFVALVLYGLSGFYQVGTNERAVVLQLGAFRD